MQRLVFLSIVLGFGITTAVRAETTPQTPAAPQPNIPSTTITAPKKPTSPVVEQIVRPGTPKKAVRERVVERSVPRHHRTHVTHRYPRRQLDRPALAGVQLIAPLSPPPEPPHFTVPVPAYPLESVAASITTPPPPIVCHHTRRDPTQPDPRLYREFPVECEPDNP